MRESFFLGGEIEFYLDEKVTDEDDDCYYWTRLAHAYDDRDVLRKFYAEFPEGKAHLDSLDRNGVLTIGIDKKYWEKENALDVE